jgi:hypothetical protein
VTGVPVTGVPVTVVPVAAVPGTGVPVTAWSAREQIIFNNLVYNWVSETGVKHSCLISN